MRRSCDRANGRYCELKMARESRNAGCQVAKVTFGADYIEKCPGKKAGFRDLSTIVPIRQRLIAPMHGAGLNEILVTQIASFLQCHLALPWYHD